MGKKNSGKDKFVVYSTNPDFNYEDEGGDADLDLNSSKQKLYVFLDRKQRKGKDMTCIEGFRGSANEMNDLGRELKTTCGSGGAVKEGLIMVQGNHVERIAKILREKGYNQTKIKGGY